MECRRERLAAQYARARLCAVARARAELAQPSLGPAREPGSREL